LEVGSDQLSQLSETEEGRLRELASEAPTVNLLNRLISRALKMRASDIHIEPSERSVLVRYRIDGVLQDAETVPLRLQLPLVSRVKILAGMDIAERRRPQDGKIELRISNIDLDIRVSALPLQEGESVVMRLLRKDSISYSFDSLDLLPDTKAAISADLARTTGVILMTGPTGSGKTTSLYTFLSHLNQPGVKIITLEDPVEYQLPGLNQVQVRPEIDFDFNAGLRSIVRQDPDVIMVGEIRDQETCRIALQAALTGHLVFSTVHTNDAASAFTRLLDLGVPEYLLNAALLSVMAQRLVRRLCPDCSVQSDAQKEVIDKYQLSELMTRFNVDKPQLRKVVGCESCNHTGYRGRIAIIEYLQVEDRLKAISKDDQFLSNARQLNIERGFRSLIEDGMLRALQGETTPEEVARVCG
jgi:general secretion pathway protein E